MRTSPVLLTLAAVTLVAGCAARGRLTATRSPGVETLPRNIAIYPLLTTDSPRRLAIHPRNVDPRAQTLDRGEIFLEAPADSRLVVDLHSQLLTGLLASDLAYHGFELKELPVELPESHPHEKVTRFAISLKLLDTLREDYDVQAVLVGNVFIVPDRIRPPERMVKVAYLKLIDIATLDILAHLSLTYDDAGGTLEGAAAAIAEEMAALAQLTPSTRVEVNSMAVAQ
jgi:hypothetical protein